MLPIEAEAEAMVAFLPHQAVGQLISTTAELNASCGNSEGEPRTRNRILNGRAGRTQAEDNPHSLGRAGVIRRVSKNTRTARR